MIDIAVVDNDRMLLEGMGSWLSDGHDGRDGHDGHDGHDGLRLAATAATVDELLSGGAALFRGAEPAGVVLLDLLLGDGSEPRDNVCRLVAAGLRVLVVSVSGRRDHIASAFAAGASGYLTKDHDLSTLAVAVREVHRGEVSCSPELAMACLHDPRLGRPQLTDAERRVLLDYGSGMLLAGVANHLRTTPDAVAACLAGIAAKYRAGAPVPPAPALTALTAREREIAVLVTDGLTNRQIARRLGVTAKTVEKHVASAMSKLGVPSRAAIAGLVGRAGAD